MLNPNMPDSFFPYSGLRPPKGAVMLSWSRRIPGPCSIASNEITKGSKGLENKRPVYIRHWFLKVFLSSGNWRQIPCRKGQPGCLSIGLSWAVVNISYINGVVPLMVDLFPTSWASVSILKGITEALATEDVATFCRNNETPILHNLRVSIHTDRTTDGTWGPGSSSSIILGASRSMGSHVHIFVPRQLLIITAHHTAVSMVLAQPPPISPWPSPFFNNHNRVIVSQVHNHGL